MTLAGPGAIATADGIHHPWAEAPGPGEAIEITQGILWIRLPLPMALDHVNLYALDDGDDGWTLIDTGLNWKRGRAAWDALEAGPLRGKPVHRVILTHHHPDHIGRLGAFAAQGAEIRASRTAWLLGRMLILDRRDRPNRQEIAHRRRAGLTGDALERWIAEPPFNFGDVCVPLPLGFHALAEGDRLRAGGRDWTVRLGEGHAPAHVTLWSEGLVLAGDQIIPGISPNIGVWPTEPEGDPLAGWLESCRRFRDGLEPDDGRLVLPGHKLPFTGIAHRLDQLIENHESALLRILAHLDKDEATALELCPTLFRRDLGPAEQALALVEALAHVNHLGHKGLIAWRNGPDGARHWRRT